MLSSSWSLEHEIYWYRRRYLGSKYIVARFGPLWATKTRWERERTSNARSVQKLGQSIWTFSGPKGGLEFTLYREMDDKALLKFWRRTRKLCFIKLSKQVSAWSGKMDYIHRKWMILFLKLDMKDIWQHLQLQELFGYIWRKFRV